MLLVLNKVDGVLLALAPIEIMLTVIFVEQEGKGDSK
jgi:hypothetical protein